MRAAIAAAIRRVSDWDSRQERSTAHPWWTPRGILFWWIWRPAVFGAAFGALGLVFWIWVEAARSVLGNRQGSRRRNRWRCSHDLVSVDASAAGAVTSAACL